MADKAEKKADAAPAAHGGDKKGGGMLTKLPVLLGGVMIIEAVVLFAGFKFVGGGGPKHAEAALEGTGKEEGGEKGEKGEKSGTPADGKRLVEVTVIENFRALNHRSGHTFIYDLNVVATTKGDSEKKVKEILTERGSLIKDRIRTIIAQSDPDKLGGGTEPGLETLRRQVKYQLDIIVGEGLIDEVLVPKCIPFRAEF